MFLRRRLMIAERMWVVLGANTKGKLKTTNITMDRKVYKVGFISATGSDVTNWACSFQNKPISNPSFNSNGDRTPISGSYIDADTFGFTYIPCRGDLRQYAYNNYMGVEKINTLSYETIKLQDGTTKQVYVKTFENDMYFTLIQNNVDPTKIFVYIDKYPAPQPLQNY